MNYVFKFELVVHVGLRLNRNQKGEKRGGQTE